MPLFDDSAQSVVAKGVRHKLDQLRQQANDHSLLQVLARRQVDDKFDDAETMFVHAKFGKIRENFFKEELVLILLKVEALQHFSDHMRTLLVHTESRYMP